MSVRLEEQHGVRVALLDRPERLNALDLATVATLYRAVEEEPGVMVLGSTTPRAFSSGADLSIPDGERAAVSDALYNLYQRMREAQTIIIAAADGHAVGGGAQLLLASDNRIAGRDLAVRFVGVGHGLIVGAWGLPTLVGRGRALEACLTTRTIGAEEALSIGLVERVVDDPLAEAINLGREIRKLDPEVVAGVKKVVAVGHAGEALRAEQTLNSRWRGSLTSGETS